MGKIDLVVACCKGVSKGECVVTAVPSIAFSPETVLSVPNISAHTVPAELLRPIS